MKKKKKKGKYTNWIGDEYDIFEVIDYPTSPFDFSYSSLHSRMEEINEANDIPKELLLSLQRDPGFFFGMCNTDNQLQYVGMPQGTEGHQIVIGGSGTGKSSGIIMPTLLNWTGAICATDIKGELSAFYGELYDKGLVKRPFIVFDPLQEDCIGYDPFQYLLQDGEDMLVSNIWEIVYAIHPAPENVHDKFWIVAEQNLLAAALLYFFKIGLSFCDTILRIIKTPVKELCKKISRSDNELAQMYISEIGEMEDKYLVAFSAGLRPDLIQLSADPYICNALSGERDGSNFFTWEDLDTYNIFLKIPEDKMMQWKAVVNLMYTQLIHHLERRPDKYRVESKSNVEIELIFDEFAQFGRLKPIEHAISTLRSKSVHICIIVQSIARIDQNYGEYARRNFFENASYIAILGSRDPDTQKYLCELIGTRITLQRSASEQLDDFGDTTGYSKQLSEERNFIVQPDELFNLKDVLLLSPYTFCRAKKLKFEQLAPLVQSYAEQKKKSVIYATAYVSGNNDASI